MVVHADYYQNNLGSFKFDLIIRPIPLCSYWVEKFASQSI